MSKGQGTEPKRGAEFATLCCADGTHTLADADPNPAVSSDPWCLGIPLNLFFPHNNSQFQATRASLFCPRLSHLQFTVLQGSVDLACSNCCECRGAHARISEHVPAWQVVGSNNKKRYI